MAPWFLAEHGCHNRLFSLNFFLDGLLQTLNNPLPGSTVNSDVFGHSVALSDDGSVALVGAFGENNGANFSGPFDSGAAYLFDAATGAALQTLSNPSPLRRDFFGYSVALSGDGTTVAVTTPQINAGGDGLAYVYRDETIDLPAPGSLLLLGSTLAVMAGLGLRRRRRGEG